MQFKFAVFGARDVPGIVAGARADLAQWSIRRYTQQVRNDALSELRAVADAADPRRLFEAGLSLQTLFYWYAGHSVNDLLAGKLESGWRGLRYAVYYLNASADCSIASDSSRGNAYLSELTNALDWTLGLMLSEVLGDKRIGCNLAQHINGYFRTGVIEEVVDDPAYRAYVAAVGRTHVPQIAQPSIGDLDVYAPLVSGNPLSAIQLDELTFHHLQRVDYQSGYFTRKAITPTFGLPGVTLMPWQILCRTLSRGTWTQLANVNALLEPWAALSVPPEDTSNAVSDAVVERLYEVL